MSGQEASKNLKKIKIKKPKPHSNKPSAVKFDVDASSDGDSLLRDFLGDGFFDDDVNVSSNSSDMVDEEDLLSFETNDGDKKQAPSADDDDFENLLNEFISSEFSEKEEEKTDISDLSNVIAQAKEEENVRKLQEEEFTDKLRQQERSLFEAYRNFIAVIDTMAIENAIRKPKFSVSAKVLYPKYRPQIGRDIASDAVLGWDIMIKSHSPRLDSLAPDASDDDLLDFAEKTTDELLQAAIISYVEILIEIEGCEIEYKNRKLLAQKKKIEYEIYMEHKKRAEKMQKFTDRINKKKFPIDADRLVKNFFKTQKKDAESAFRALTTNPATFAPIDFSKMKAKFFGLIKVSPTDGIKINRKIGDFLRKLKV